MSEKTQEKAGIDTKKGWFRRNGLKVIIVLVAVSALTGISKIPQKNRETAPTEAAPTNVTVMTVEPVPEFPDTFDLPAVVEPNRVITVSAEVAGRIEQIPPKKGSFMHAGDLLIQLNTDLIKPEFERAKAQVERDQIEYERMSNLVKNDATSKSDLDNATTDLAISKATLQEVKARLERTGITSPITGPLNDLMAEEGEYVQPGTPVADIVDMSVVKVVVEVPERDIGFFKVGQKAEVFLNTTAQGKPQEGTITFISEIADENTRTTRMEITLPNKDMVMRSGQIVRARLTRQVLKDAILIPLLAVIPMEEGHVIYVVESGQAQRRQVELGIIKGDRVQVMRGLQPGDQLIIAGHRFVAPGQKVNIISDNTEIK